MVEVLKGRNHVSFTPMQTLFDLIDTEVADINVERAAKVTARGRQWVYPSTPEKIDEKYPRVAILNDNIRFEEYGTGQFLELEKVAGVTERMVFAKVAIIPVTIAVFVKRNQRHTVTYYDGVSHEIQNTKQADFIGDKIAKFLEIFSAISSQDLCFA